MTSKMIRSVVLFSSIAFAPLALAPFVFAPAQAQIPPAVTKAPAPQAQQPVDTSTPVTPEAREAIKELLEVTKMRENTRATYQQMSQAIPQQMAQMIGRSIETNASLTPEQKQQTRERLNKSFEASAREAVTIVQDPKLVDEVLDKAYPIYAKYYTPSEIRELSKFYKSPIGQKSISVMPQVMSDSIRVGVAVFEPRLTTIMERLVKQETDAVKNDASKGDASKGDTKKK